MLFQCMSIVSSAIVVQKLFSLQPIRVTRTFSNTLLGGGGGYWRVRITTNVIRRLGRRIVMVDYVISKNLSVHYPISD
jgi:hypothetical protein